jgi:hypothetical protein
LARWAAICAPITPAPRTATRRMDAALLIIVKSSRQAVETCGDIAIPPIMRRPKESRGLCPGFLDLANRRFFKAKTGS